MVRERRDEADSALIFSTGSRLLPPEEVAEAAVSLIGTKKMVLTVPRAQGALRLFGLAPRITMGALPLLQKVGDQRRRKG